MRASTTSRAAPELAIAAFSPRRNEAGNSGRAQLAIQHVAQRLGAGIFGANPEVVR